MEPPRPGVSELRPSVTGRSIIPPQGDGPRNLRVMALREVGVDLEWATRLVTQTIVALSSTPTNCGIGLSIISQPSSVSTPTTFTLMMRTTPSGTNITFTSSLL
jgi:hypothetical protein